ncbi:MAG: sigma-54-dependent Fis family transcriptional regulator, partial [Myxococcales bacterium]|nr:sigma-54-dependent Fis family transcriptional regulator [Myxococcales bacterium]
RGAFTGATNRREGAASEADGGTLFLDEIGELPLELQPKLLRLLEQRELRRVGGTKTEPVDVRVVAATHRDLAAEVNRGTFREDLYYRLAVIELHVPPLRERRDDLPQLIRHLIERSVDGDATRASRVLDGLSPASWERLRAHTYPGNVRELRNLVERMLVLGDAAPEARPPAPSSTPTTGLASFVDPTREWMEQKRQLVGALEAAYLRAVLDAHDGNYTQAAAAAGIERMYFKRLLKKYEGA